MEFPRNTIHDVEDWTAKKVLTRVDFNVPLDEQRRITDRTRLTAARPTIHFMLDQGAVPVLMSHLGRPGGVVKEELRLDPVVEPLEEILDCTVRKADDVIGDGARDMVSNLKPGEVGLLENLRFDPGEKQCDPDFSRSLAAFGGLYVNDAFAASHRRHASITGVPDHLRPAVAGDLLFGEWEKLIEVYRNPERPFAAVLGGAKIADKLSVIEFFLDQAERVLIGGAMSYTFELARGGSVGDSLVEPDFVDQARNLLEQEGQRRGELVLPTDVVIGPTEDPTSETRVVPSGEIPDGWEGMDIGPETRERFEEALSDVKMVFWNGPMGVFEQDPFTEGTRGLIEALDRIPARVIVGGGDTASAVHTLGDERSFEHVSTGGGASLELVHTGSLPGIDALDERTHVDVV